MKIKSYEILSFTLLLFIITTKPLYSSNLTRKHSNLGVEVGVGHSQLFWKVPNRPDGDRTQFFLKPTIRMVYKVNVMNKIYLLPLIGYDVFGGKSKKEENGYEDNFVFKSLEVGSLLGCKIKNIEIASGMKYNYHLKITQNYYGSFYQSPEERKWETEDWTDEFKNYSIDVGIRIGWHKDHFSLSFDTWIGVTDFLKNSIYAEEEVEGRLNHFRIMIGYMP